MDMLHSAHPSFRAERATFLFAMRGEGGIRRLLLVEAKNAMAVQFLERLVAPDGTVSDTCAVMTVHLRSDDIGVRSDLVDIVPYVQFVSDIVDPGRVTADPLAEMALCASLDDRERAVLEATIRSRAARPARSSRPALPGPSLVPPAPGPDRRRAEHERGRLEEALLGLGFKKPQVRAFVDEQDSRIGAVPIEDLVREALLQLTAR